MSVHGRAQKAVEMLKHQAGELSSIVYYVEKDSDFNVARERMLRWKERTAKLISDCISPGEGAKFSEKRLPVVIAGQPIRNLIAEADIYRGFIFTLIEELINYPQQFLTAADEPGIASPKNEVSQKAGNNSIFIIHGHDELNLLRLKELLRDRWNLNTIILRGEPGKGRTLIEKFEQEANKAAYVIALFTPDDLVKVSDDQYTQARPNVVFELGWFYGRLGRERVCILFKSGMQIHSDLDGINRIEFNSDINEKIVEIEKELESAGLINIGKPLKM
ncbi:MAG: TIR domain-containing protein [Bacillota bacterium]